MIDKGHGPVVVLLPGIQGRWEWMTPAIDALAVRHRVLGFSFSDLPSSGSSFDDWVAMIDRALDRAGVSSATVVGASFGGLVAIHYAAARSARVHALVLASAPSPRWRPDPRTRVYMKYARLVMPMLVVRSIVRLTPEILATHAAWGTRLRIGAAYAWRALRSPLSSSQMVRWVHAWLATDVEAACRRITSPTTIITGEPALDRVVPTASTMEIAELIPHARRVVFRGTGHIGAITRPEQFVELIDEAIASAAAAYAASHCHQVA